MREDAGSFLPAEKPVLSSMVGDLQKDIDRCKASYARMWWETETGFPLLRKKYSAAQQRSIERELDLSIKRISERLKSSAARQDHTWMGEFVREFKDSGGRILKLSDLCLDAVLNDDFLMSTRRFIQRVKEFDPAQGLENIYQALRNVWIMNSLQVYLGKKVEYSDPIFAYSLIYPYTDNILDDVEESFMNKWRMSLRLKDRLEGKAPVPENEDEERIFQLIQMIETRFPRGTYPDVYRSLLAIFNAQMKSLRQQKGRILPYETDILGISMEKGGTSVLADGFLVNGNLSPKQMDFCFGFGIFLQFSDDIQDVTEDTAHHHMTIFSQNAGRRELDRLANKLLNFIQRIVQKKLDSQEPNEESLKEIILDNTTFLVLEALGRNKEYYSPGYIRRMQSHFPVRFSFLEKSQKKIGEMFSQHKTIVADHDFISAFLLAAMSEVPGR